MACAGYNFARELSRERAVCEGWVRREGAYVAQRVALVVAVVVVVEDDALGEGDGVGAFAEFREPARGLGPVDGGERVEVGALGEEGPEPLLLGVGVGLRDVGELAEALDLRAERQKAADGEGGVSRARAPNREVRGLVWFFPFFLRERDGSVFFKSLGFSARAGPHRLLAVVALLVVADADDVGRGARERGGDDA